MNNSSNDRRPFWLNLVSSLPASMKVVISLAIGILIAVTFLMSKVGEFWGWGTDFSYFYPNQVFGYFIMWAFISVLAIPLAFGFALLLARIINRLRLRPLNLLIPPVVFVLLVTCWLLVGTSLSINKQMIDEGRGQLIQPLPLARPVATSVWATSQSDLATKRAEGSAYETADCAKWCTPRAAIRQTDESKLATRLAPPPSRTLKPGEIPTPTPKP